MDFGGSRVLTEKQGVGRLKSSANPARRMTEIFIAVGGASGYLLPLALRRCMTRGGTRALTSPPRLKTPLMRRELT